MLKQFTSKFHHDYDETVSPNFPSRTVACINSVIVITKERVRKHLLILDRFKHSGEDSISNELLKLAATSQDKPL
jgi:hypothetical protein